eukprot:2251340-Alexandrium_andersonii.AAC.1
MLKAFEARTARAQTRPQDLSPKLLRGAFCAVVRAVAESADEAGRQAPPEGASRVGRGGGASAGRLLITLLYLLCSKP